MLCQRCKKEYHHLEPDTYCDRLVCQDCIKSSKRATVTTHLVICKDCWGDLAKRAKFKSA